MDASDQPTSFTTVQLLAGYGSSGRPVLEQVPARPVGPGTWELLSTPGLALGAAAGDRVTVGDHGDFTVVARSGIVGVYVTGPAAAAGLLHEVTERIKALGGWMDGGAETRGDQHFLRIYNVPVKAGFPAIEAAVGSFTSEVPGTAWYYSNVYDPDDEVTPLNWWLDLP